LLIFALRLVATTFFIGQEAADPDSDVAGALEVAGLRADIAELREELRKSALT